MKALLLMVFFVGTAHANECTNLDTPKFLKNKKVYVQVVDDCQERAYQVIGFKEVTSLKENKIANTGRRVQGGFPNNGWYCHIKAGLSFEVSQVEFSKGSYVSSIGFSECSAVDAEKLQNLDTIVRTQKPYDFFTVCEENGMLKRCDQMSNTKWDW